ncbi:methyltransferase type 11 [Hyaloraphidium curvatum]|nr:methyltransferase type 11 [Hyaloraphidium curvatum]
MPTQEEHYEKVLSAHYDWMTGAGTPELFDTRVGDTVEKLRSLGIFEASPSASRIAVDAGCGSGYQSLALAKLGFDVIAVDTSRRLLDALEANAARVGLADRIKAVDGDMLQFRSFLPGGPDAKIALFVCMGDTLTHCTSMDEAAKLLRDAASNLVPGGRIVLSFRHLKKLEGLDRFIPVRSEDNRIFTVFLETPEGEDRVGGKVLVHDLVYVKDPAGSWTLAKSFYPKIRIDSASVVAMLRGEGLEISRVEDGPMIFVVAEKPAK